MLVTTHHLHFGNFLAARISPENSDQQNRTLEVMANALAGPQQPRGAGQAPLAYVPVMMGQSGAAAPPAEAAPAAANGGGPADVGSASRGGSAPENS